MPLELKVPSLGESITEVFIGQWRRQVGDQVAKDENLVEIESDKATVELAAPSGGVITQVLKRKGDTAQVGEVIGYLEPAGAGAAPAAPAPAAPAPAAAAPPSSPTPAAASPAAPRGPAPASVAPAFAPAAPAAEARVMPAARRELFAQGLSAHDVPASGPGGRMLKEDVLRAAAATEAAARQAAAPVLSPVPAPLPTAPAPAALAPLPPAPAMPAPPRGPAPAAVTGVELAVPHRQEEVVPMSPIRRRIAQRLVEAQHAAALLTTFNEVDMSAVMQLRQEYKEGFQQRYNVKLGFMSFFVRAVVDALKLTPQVNAEIRGNDIVYRNYYDIGIAVAGGKGLVVPVLRNAERMSFAEIEVTIEQYAKLARENKLTLDQLQGGTFTISNGGVFGSLLSTPIVNPPQSGILGLHSIQDRPVVRGGEIVIRPMMYLALTYDHRIIDGREAVTFLRRIKEVIEQPSRLMLEI